MPISKIITKHILLLLSIGFVISCGSTSRTSPSSKYSSSYSGYIGDGFGTTKKKNINKVAQFGFYKQKNHAGFANKLYVSLAGIFGDDYTRSELGINAELNSQAYNNKMKNQSLAKTRRSFSKGKHLSFRTKRHKTDNSADAFARPVKK